MLPQKNIRLLNLGLAVLSPIQLQVGLSVTWVKRKRWEIVRRQIEATHPQFWVK